MARDARIADATRAGHNPRGDATLIRQLAFLFVASPQGPLASQGGKTEPTGPTTTPEIRSRFTETTYEITVRLDKGNSTTLQRSDGANFRVGDRVRIHGILVELLAP